MKENKYHSINPVLKSNQTIIDTEAKSIRPLTVLLGTHAYTRPLTVLLGTATPINKNS